MNWGFLGGILLIICSLFFQIISKAYIPEKGTVRYMTAIANQMLIEQEGEIKKYKVKYGDIWTGGSMEIPHNIYSQLKVGDTFCFSLDHDLTRKFVNLGECR